MCSAYCADEMHRVLKHRISYFVLKLESCSKSCSIAQSISFCQGSFLWVWISSFQRKLFTQKQTVMGRLWRRKDKISCEENTLTPSRLQPPRRTQHTYICSKLFAHRACCWELLFADDMSTVSPEQSVVSRHRYKISWKTYSTCRRSAKQVKLCLLLFLGTHFFNSLLWPKYVEARKACCSWQPELSIQFSGRSVNTGNGFVS